MRNGYNVVWTNKALADLDSLILYLETHWTNKEITNLIRKLDQRIDLIAHNPKLYALTKSRRNVRRSVLVPQLSIYYRINRNSVEILTLFDNRQSPQKLKV